MPVTGTDRNDGRIIRAEWLPKSMDRAGTGTFKEKACAHGKAVAARARITQMPVWICAISVCFLPLPRPLRRSPMCQSCQGSGQMLLIGLRIRSNLINTSCTRLALRSVEAIWQHARDPIRSCRHTGGSHCGSSSGEVCCAKCSVFARASPRISMRRHALQALVHACKKALCKRRTVRS